MAAPGLERVVEHGVESLVLARRPPRSALEVTLQRRQHRPEEPRHVTGRREEEPVPGSGTRSGNRGSRTGLETHGEGRKCGGIERIRSDRQSTSSRSRRTETPRARASHAACQGRAGRAPAAVPAPPPGSRRAVPRARPRQRPARAARCARGAAAPAPCSAPCRAARVRRRRIRGSRGRETRAPRPRAAAAAPAAPAAAARAAARGADAHRARRHRREARSATRGARKAAAAGGTKDGGVASAL